MLLLGGSGALAADASPWDGDQRSAVRLVAGPTDSGDQSLQAGIEIRLARGWKTYWRYPGDSGVPPRFAFGQSQNVGRAEVLWPAPKSFADESGVSIGYADDVILPVRVVAARPEEPVVLRLAIDYAVCNKLCVPASGQAELMLPVAASAHAAAVATSEARVPVKTAINSSRGGLKIAAVTVQDGVPHPHIVVEVEAPAQTKVELFAEGPTAEWALPVPRQIDTAGPEVHRFGFDLDGVPAKTSSSGAALTLTAVAGDKAIEVEFHLK